MDFKEAVKFYYDKTYGNARGQLNVGDFEKELFRFCEINKIDNTEVAPLNKAQRGQLYASLTGKKYIPNGCQSCFGGLA